jgi:hypothetical protein
VATAVLIGLARNSNFPRSPEFATVGNKSARQSVWREDLAVGFEEDRARLGLPATVDRLRDALAYNGPTLDSDAAPVTSWRPTASGSGILESVRRRISTRERAS